MLTRAQQKLELLVLSVSLVFFVVSLVLLEVGTVCMDSILNIVLYMKNSLRGCYETGFLFIISRAVSVPSSVRPAQDLLDFVSYHAILP